MDRKSVQTPSAVIMVRPHHFSPNEETAGDNAFQRPLGNLTREMAARQAYDEITEMASALEHAGVCVHVFDDTSVETPDSVFPNNWFSTHQGGHVALYPMFAPSRRKERRTDIVEMLKREYRVQDVIDYSGLEVDGLYLEGTGAMVLDHRDRLAYVVRSNRADPVALERFCTHFNYEPMAFDAIDANGKAVYHTNVLMCIATDFALIGLDFITDRARREEIVARLEESGRDVIALTNESELDGTEPPQLRIKLLRGRRLTLDGQGERRADCVKLLASESAYGFGRLNRLAIGQNDRSDALAIRAEGGNQHATVGLELFEESALRRCDIRVVRSRYANIVPQYTF